MPSDDEDDQSQVIGPYADILGRLTRANAGLKDDDPRILIAVV